MRIWWSSVAVLSLAGSVWIATASADGGSPTTKPAPAAPPAAASTPKEAPGKDWVHIVNKAGGFDFYVPKKWGAGQTSDQADSFTLPAPVIKAPTTPASPNAPTQSLNVKPSVFSITVQKGKATTLKAAVDAARNSAFSTPDDEGNKTDSDKETKLDGKPAWLLETEEKYVAGTVTTPAPGGKPSQTHDIKHALKTYKLIAVVGTNEYDVTFVADGRQYATGMNSVDKVLETFSWADDAGK